MSHSAHIQVRKAEQEKQFIGSIMLRYYHILRSHYDRLLGHLQRVCLTPLIVCTVLSTSGFLAQTHAAEADDGELPLFSIQGVQYRGGFRLPDGRFGSGDNSTHSYSPGPIAYNSVNDSLFTVSHDYEQGIGEFKIPAISPSTDVTDFATASVLQNFRAFHQSGQPPTGIDNYFLITGLALVNQKLVVNFINWYDANGRETDTSAVFQSPSNLAESAITGPFQLNGAAHAAGWLTPIPPQWRSALGGDHVAGHAHGSIVSRLSVGPPAHVLSVGDLTQASEGTAIATTPVLDFSLANPLYDRDLYDLNETPYDDVAYNRDGRNRLWTRISGASYGFIIPNTGTYMTLGYAGGFESGLGYKITQTDGNVCGGPCSYDPQDNYNFYWLWRVADMVKVKDGELQPHDLRPYEYGRFNTNGNRARIKGAAFDASSNRLFVSLQRGDPLPRYSRPPLVLVYELDTSITTVGAPSTDEFCVMIPMKPKSGVYFCL